MFWKSVQRALIVPLAFVLAALAAAFVIFTLAVEQLTHSFHDIKDEAKVFEMLIDVITQAGTFLPALTLIPALAVVIIGEVARIRAFLYYLLGGGAALAAIPLLARLAASQPTAAMPDSLVWPLFATAGFTAGALYWLIAGRNA